MVHTVVDKDYERPAGDPRVAETREVVLTAARRLISDEGQDAVTPTRLMAMTGVSRSTIYRHWADPKAIIFEATASDTTRLPFEAHKARSWPRRSIGPNTTTRPRMPCVVSAHSDAR